MEELNEQAIMEKIAETMDLVSRGMLEKEKGDLIITELEEELSSQKSAPKKTNGKKQDAGEDELVQWADPEPLPTLPDAPAWDDALLPEVFRPAVVDIADRMQCAPDYVASALVVAAGSVIGRSCAIRPKRLDDWAVTPNVWGAAIGRPSELKTPAVTQALKSLRRLEQDAAEAFDLSEFDRKSVRMELEALDTLMKGAIKKGTKDLGEIREEFAGDFEILNEQQQELEKRKRLLLHDSTVEKLGMILAENDRGVMLFRDELVGFLRSLDKVGHENDRAFYLEAWSGSGGYSYDRVGRGTLYIKSACVSLFGTIQPGPLQTYLNGALSGDDGDDGLIQRFQIIVYPEPVRDWKNIDRKPDRDALDALFEVFGRLDKATPETLGAETEFDSLPFVRFNDAAQEVFNDWRMKLEHRLRQGNEHPAFEAHLAKFRSLVPSLALIFHLIDNEHGPVEEPSILRAVKWAVFLEVHARRVYASCISPEIRAAKEILAKVKSGELQSPFAARDVYRRQWSGLTKPVVVKGGVELLVDLGWARLERDSRNRTVAVIHPEVLRDPQAQAAQ